jgi:hypothetical protein
LQGQNQLPKVVSDVTFHGGIEAASDNKPPLDSRHHLKSSIARAAAISLIFENKTYQ